MQENKSNQEYRCLSQRCEHTRQPGRSELWRRALKYQITKEYRNSQKGHLCFLLAEHDWVMRVPRVSLSEGSSRAGHASRSLLAGIPITPSCWSWLGGTASAAHAGSTAHRKGVLLISMGVAAGRQHSNWAFQQHY